MNQKKYRDVLPSGYQLHWYELQSVLGRGAYGITYLAMDQNLQQPVAIKEYLPTEFASRENDHTVHPVTGEQREIYEWGLDRFLREARTLAKFKHPNIVRVLSVFEKNNTAYMIMEYEQGEDLAKIFKKQKNMPEAKLLDIFIPILDGLSLVHAEGFIHRDIKPSNIYIRQDESPVLIDFGSARQTKHGPTRALTSLVTYGYAPFEQYNEGEDKQGPWTDLYAMAASLYLAIVDKLPMDALSRGSGLLNEKVDPYEPVSVLAQDKFSPHFLLAVDYAMMFRAQDRPQDVKTWADMLTGKVPVPPLPATVLVPKNTPGDASKTVLMPGDYISFRHTDGQPPPQGATPQTDADQDSTVVRATGPSQRIDTGVNTDLNSQASASYAPQSNVEPSTSTPRNNKKMIALGAIFAVIIGTAVLATRFISNGEVSPSPDTALATDVDTKPDDTTADTQRINALLQVAQSDIAAQNFLAPQNNNARQRFLTVLELDPNNKAAREGLKEVIDMQVSMIEEQLNTNFMDEASKNIELLAAIAPNLPQTLNLQRKLTTISQSEQNTEINQLLKQAKLQFKKRRLIKPDNDNAFNRYQRVLDIDPNNKAALNGIEEIISYYYSAAEQHLAKRNFSKVKRIIKNIEYINPDSAAARRLSDNLAKAKQNQRHITTLLADASRDFKAGHFIEPKNKNAHQRYRQVLKLDRSNPTARQGIINIENHYKKQFDAALTKKDLVKAESLLTTMREFAPDAAVTRYASTELNNVQKSLKPSRSDIEVISEIIGKYKSHFETRNVRELENISNFKPGRKNFVTQFFDQYQSVEVVVSGFRYIGKEHKGMANISLTQLVNKRGSSIKPGTWSQFEIVVSKNKQGQWKVLW